MENFAKETLPISLEEEMRRSYLDYAMSVIVGRALPDVRDGLKPVHRRVLFAMHEANNAWNRPYVKCARIVGEVLGKYHPHGDSATYEALVRMAQDFSMRYALIDGQGNFGSVDGDAAAAYRYTECRLEKIAAELLADIDRETVDFAPNYDGKELEPGVLPTRAPNLLVNGSSGIAVGMATNIPPHNLAEVVDACLHVLASPHCAIEDIIKLVPAPDFPTSGIIYGIAGVHEGYRTGRGRVLMRARTHFEEFGKGDRTAIIVDELPYQVNKKALLEKLAELVTDKRLEGISDLRDESDKSGMRMVIELKRGEIPDVVLNNLYKMTQLQDSFHMNMVALVDGQPRLLNLKDLIDAFLSHRREVVTRRTVFELRKARERGHVLEGLALALSNVDEVIELIKKAPNAAEARRGLMERPWPSDLVSRMVGDGAAQYRPQGLPQAYGLLSPVRGPGAGDHRAAAEAPDGPRAGQDPRGIPRGDRDHHRSARHPGQAQPHHHDHRRGARQAEGGVRRQEEERDHHRRRGHLDRGPDRAAGHGGHLLARRLREIPAARRLPRPAPRRARQDGDRDEGGRLHRAPVRSALARPPAVLL
jgi:DNA gyrase subunit A